MLGESFSCDWSLPSEYVFLHLKQVIINFIAGPPSNWISFCCGTRVDARVDFYCVFSSFPILYDTILLQSILVRVTGSCLRNALNVVSDIVW